ncbi:MAG TPA: DMT family transporter [Thermomicrobiales bacterium]|nr:DMT family transporter [Thermomicrobiales bacterium]
MGFLAAACAALGWGLDAVLARQGLRRLPPAVGLVCSLAASLVVCALLTLAFERGRLWAYPAAGFAWFGLVGLVNFFVGRQCNFRATKRLGAARAAAIFATSPLVSIALAVAFTGERVSPLLLAGAALVVAGMVLVVTS